VGIIDVLAVDGGQSSVRLLHSASASVVEVDGVSRQEGDVIVAVTNSIAEGWRLLGSPRVDRAVLGLSTAPVGSSARERMCTLAADAIGAPEIWLTDDAVTSGIGALSGRPGVSLTVGTGVACLAVPVEGVPRIIGGHGYLLGDEGGGYWLGRRGLSAVLRAMEGRGPSTALTPAAEARFGDLADLHVRIHDAPRAVDAIARFATDVISAAGDADLVASEILDEAAAELAGVVGAAAESVGGDAVPVRFGGRLLSGASELRTRLERVIAATVSSATTGPADASGLDGAMALGLQEDAGRFTTLVYEWHAATAA
jgi:N-acetylglucosamine kinase-like BadF-type ATPase